MVTITLKEALTSHFPSADHDVPRRATEKSWWFSLPQLEAIDKMRAAAPVRWDGLHDATPKGTQTDGLKLRCPDTNDEIYLYRIGNHPSGQFALAVKGRTKEYPDMMLMMGELERLLAHPGTAPTPIR